MFRQTELNIPIERVAEALGLRPGLVKDMFYSPERDESEASLHIDRAKNVWYDHGSGEGRNERRPCNACETLLQT